MGGLCGVSNKQSDADVMPRGRPRTTTTSEGSHLEQRKSQAKTHNNNKFQDMEEYTDGRVIGEGIKEIPAYKCNLAYDELDKLRAEFWATKTSRVWAVLKTCCETDALSAKEILNAEELECVGNNMRCVICLSNPDIIYNIPNFCIVDPLYEKDYSEAKKAEGKVMEKPVKVILCNIFKNEEKMFQVSNKIKGSDLKGLYANATEISLDKYRIRLLYKGQEIADDHSLFYHNPDDVSCRIQVSVVELS